MNIVIAIAAYIVLSFAVGGCASPKPGSPEATALNIKEQEQKKAETVSRTLGITPDWFLKPSISNNAIYTTGTGVSPNLQMSLDKSLINAKRALADRLNGLLSAKSKLFSVEQGQGEATIATTETEQVTTNLISEVNVGGYSIKERETFAEGSRYRSFVLLEYPLGKLNRIQLETLRKQQEAESQHRAERAHKELEKDIKGKR